jgi:hypothetical protein
LPRQRARKPRPPMASREIRAWQIGADRAVRGVSLVAFLNAPRWLQDRQMTAEQVQERGEMGHDTWAAWVWRGFNDTHDTHRLQR